MYNIIMNTDVEKLTRYQKNKEKILQKAKEYYEKNKEKKKEYYEKNKERIKEDTKNRYYKLGIIN